MSTSTNVPASNQHTTGVSRGASNVDTAVIPTDNAKSPFARYVITFDAVPPGQQPTNITPTAISWGKLKIFVSKNANNGIMVNWAMQPIMTFFGRENTILKSLGFNVMPIHNIMMPNIQLM